MAQTRILMEYKELLKDPNYFFSIHMNNIFDWDFVMIGPDDTLYEGGTFNGKIIFPPSYPHKPPQVKFTSKIVHPNIYLNGKVCISILHEGVDQYGYEDVSERWSPTQSINSIMMSILSLFSCPNFDSPANVDYAVLYKKNYDLYKKQIYAIIANSN
jgi:ubiquitin-conjugating enzyme E2 G1